MPSPTPSDRLPQGTRALRHCCPRACRLTYEEADADIALGPGAQHQELQLLYEAARLRYAQTAGGGGLQEGWGGEV